MEKETLEKIKVNLERTIDELEFVSFTSCSSAGFHQCTKDALNAIYKYYALFIKHVYSKKCYDKE